MGMSESSAQYKDPKFLLQMKYTKGIKRNARKFYNSMRRRDTLFYRRMDVKLLNCNFKYIFSFIDMEIRRKAYTKIS